MDRMAMAYFSVLVAGGGLVVACLPLDPRFAGSNLAEDDGFSRVIKICNTIFFEVEVKLSVPCRKIYDMLKDTMSMKMILHRQNSVAISCQVFPAFLLDVSTGNLQTDLVDESEMIRNQIGTHNRSEMVAVQGSPCVPTP
jgi:hypothetical protein